MNRINVTFYDETYEKLEQRMKNKSIKSIAHCIRELVDLGLKIEEAASKNDENQGEDEVMDMLIDLKKQLKNNLVWSLETRLLSRYLVENISEDDQDKKLAILEKYKKKANQHIEKMLGKVEN